MRGYKVFIFIMLLGIYGGGSFIYRNITEKQRKDFCNSIAKNFNILMMPETLLSDKSETPKKTNYKDKAKKDIPVKQEVVKNIKKADEKIEVSEKNLRTSALSADKKEESIIDRELPKAEKKVPTPNNPFLTEKEFEFSTPILESYEIKKAEYDHIYYGELEIKAGLYRNEIVKVSYAIPMDKKNKPIPSAHNVIFHAPFLNEGGYFKRSFHKWFIEKAGYTLFSMKIKANRRELGDREKIYNYPESGFHKLVFKAKEQIERKHRIKRRKLLVVGESLGGSMAQMMGVHNETKIDAVGMIGAGISDMPKRKSNVAVFSMSTWGDSGAEIVKEYKAEAKKYNNQVLQILTPPCWWRNGTQHFHHSPSETGLKMIQYFIKGVVDLREANKGKLPKHTEWENKIEYNGETLYFPSAEFAGLWKKLQHDKIADLMNRERDKTKPVVIYPFEQKANKIIIFIHDPDLNNSTYLLDNMYLLVEKGAIAISIEMTDDYFTTLKNIKNLINWTLETPQWEKYPIYVVGNKCGGMLASVAAFQSDSDRISKVVTINSPYEWPFKDLNPALYHKQSRIKLEAIYSKNTQVQIKPAESANTKLIEIEDKGWEPWFNTLERISTE